MQGISEANKLVAMNYGNEIYTKRLALMDKSAPVSPTTGCQKVMNVATTILGFGAKKVEELVPDPKKLGGMVGKRVADTCSAPLTNRMIEIVSHYLYADQIERENAARAGGYGSFSSWFRVNAVVPSVIEGTKLALTPVVSPYVSTGICFLGQALFPLGFTAAKMTYNYFVPPQKEVPELKKDVGSLIDRMEQKEDGTLLFNGESLTKKDLENLQNRMEEYTACQALLKASGKTTARAVDNFFKKYLAQENGVYHYSDGARVNPLDAKTINAAKEILYGVNPTGEEETIQKAIEIITHHTSTKEAEELGNGDIRCGGIYRCATNGKLYTQAQYEARTKRKEEAKMALEKEFVCIENYV